MPVKYSYNKATEIRYLTDEINQSSITTALSYINCFSNYTDIYMESTLSIDDETTLNTVVADHDKEACVAKILAGDKDVKEKKFQVSVYENNKLVTDTWYNIDNGGENYSVKVEETTYTYSGNKVLSKIIKTFYGDGTEASSETWQYFMDGTKQILKRTN